MTLQDYIQQAVQQIKAGVADFNKDSNSVKVSYPEKVSFEVYVDNEGFVGGNHKVVMEVFLAHYPWVKD